MALAMTPVAPVQDDIMDIDIEMDVDHFAPVIEEDDMLEEGEEPSFESMEHQAKEGEIPAIYLEDPAQEPCWEKVHLKGVDEMGEHDIKNYANDYFPNDGDKRKEPYVQWIDDTSVNLVYKTNETAREALLSFLASPATSDEIINNPLELRTAKPLITKPAFTLSVRIAVVGDKKKKDARHASRYYLFHPEADPTERVRREFASNRPSRSENGDYRRRRFDDREHRRRKHQDDNNDTTTDFEASMYDDAPASTERGRDLFSRISKSRQRSASPVSNGDAIHISDSDDDGGKSNRRRRNGYRNRDSPPPRERNAGRELFGKQSDGAGMRSEYPDLLPRKQQSVPKLNTSTSYESNQGVARQLKADLFAAQNNSSPIRSHRRTKAVDTRVEEDLVERFGRKSISLDSTKSVTQKTANFGKELFSNDVNGGFSIKGSATQGMSIKGRADVKELFPDRFSTGTGHVSGGGRKNAGKELFDQPVRSRGPRQRAGDLFE